MADTVFTTPESGSSGSGSGIGTKILFGAVLALIGACGYLYYELGQMRTEMVAMRDSFEVEISRVHETSSVNTQTNKRSVDVLKTELAAARQQASQLAGQAKIDASQHADELAGKLEKLQEEQARKVSAVTAEVSQVKEDATATRSRVGEVSTEVSGVKSDLSSTKADLEKAVADLKRTNGDLGVQSGLIATNGRELAMLKQLGERNYTEFKLAKEKAPRKVGEIQLRLKSADPKKNRYTVEVIADDKLVEKKDKTINEPVQFMLSRATQPFELVVNEVKKDLISGYLSAPKVQQSRSQAN